VGAKRWRRAIRRLPEGVEVLLLGRARSLLLQGFSFEPVFYAYLLPTVAGAVSLTAGRLASSVPAEIPLQQWSWEACFFSVTSAAGGGLPTSKAPPWPFFKPVKGSDVCSTSFVRPLLRFASALIVCKAASGFVPASGQAAAALTSCSTEEKEKDQFAIFYLTVMSFLLMLGTHVFLLILWGSFVTMYSSIVILI
jgi:hypothetical protein